MNKYLLWGCMSALCWYARKTVAGDDPIYSPLAAAWPYTWALSVVGVLIVGKKKLERDAIRAKADKAAMESATSSGDAQKVKAS